VQRPKVQQSSKPASRPSTGHRRSQ
jgi:hypothetical protein